MRALLLGRFNVSYDDLNMLAYPVLRHRMKLNFEAIAERVSPDEIITMILKELNPKKIGGSETKAEIENNAKEQETKPFETEEPKKQKRGLFGKK